ncbi:HAD family hydrolase [Corallincola platygyrae]|uniref:HAD family hydrolase n=1 Tax=Corallincola platygyrae TaxID=1193278 RepID=A0ABW4XKG1_9GAMM
MPTIKGVLFDLDGTLLDTAPDLGDALNFLLARENLPTLSDDEIRPVASHGAKGLLDLGFGKGLAEDYFEMLRQDFLDRYSTNLCHRTGPFSGIDTLIEELESSGIPWGIVTNKPAWLTDPLMSNFAQFANAGCVISGDTLPVRKPDPTPLLHAAELINVAAEHCLYIGDAQRDIEAGNRAGMTTMVATYGYLAESDQPERWQADVSVAHPDEIALWLTELQQIEDSVTSQWPTKAY